MKVIFVTREGYNLAGGRIRSYNFARELAKRGIATRVLSYAEDLGAKDGVHERSMTSLEKIKYNVMAYKELSQEKNAIIVLQRVNYHSAAPFLSRIAGKSRLVLDIDDWEIREDPKYLFGFYPTSKAEYLTKKIAALSDFCITGSLYLKDFIDQYSSQVYYIPSGADLEKFCPDGKGAEEGIIRFAWIGTLHRKDDVENVKFIIDCFKDLRLSSVDASLEIVGDGIYRKEIEEYISKCRLAHKINFVGWIHPDKMPCYLDGIDIGLFPLIQKTRFNLSKSPTKLFEYMAMGKPTVSSCIGEAEAIITDGEDGFLAEDRKTFIGRMETLVKDNGLRKDIGENAKRKVMQNYSLSVIGERLYTIFTDMYGGR